MRTWLVRDLMSRDVITAPPDAGYRELADMMLNHMISGLPVIDQDRRVVGVVSESDVIAAIEYSDRRPRHPLAVRGAGRRFGPGSGMTANDLMTAPAITIGWDASVAQAARRLDASRVKRLPVVDGDQRLVGIVSRRDLMRLYTRDDAAIRADVLDALCEGFRTEDVTVSVWVQRGVVRLSGSVSRPSLARMSVDLTRLVPGVLSVVDELTIQPGDRRAVAA